MLTKKKIITSIILIFGILLLINILADRFFVRLDFTAGHQYTLSSTTKDILNSLTEPVTVTAYFSENLPPDIEQVRKDFLDMLVEYSSASGGKIVYQFIDPNKDQVTEEKAQQAGIQPLVINVRDRDQMKQQRAYLGAVLQYGNKIEKIPFIQPGSAMEYSLSSTIKKLTLKEKTKIAFLQGNGEPPIASMQQLSDQLSIMYDINPLTLTDSTQIPSYYKTLVIIAPSDTIPPLYLKQFDNFLSNGGRILLAFNTVRGNLSNATGESMHTGLGNWLKSKGIYVQNSFVVDANCGSVMIRQQQGIFVMNTPVKFPYLPLISNFADHPITKGITSVMMPFVSPVKFNNLNTEIHYTTLASSSDKSGVQTPPVYFNVSKQWNKNDFPLSSIPIAVAAEGKIAGNNYSKIVVFGNGDFAVNGIAQDAQQLSKDNVNLMANSIDWLSDDTGLIDLRTKEVTTRPLNPNLSENTKTLIKYLNFLLPLFLIIGFGIIRYNKRKFLRIKWMNEKYVR